MPIDLTQPIRTVDQRGNTIETKGLEKPIKTVDTRGRLIDATEIQMQTNNTIPSTETSDPKTPSEGGEKPISEADIRKEYLAARKATKEANALNKSAKESSAKATAFENAVNLASSGGDPTAILTAAGLDPIKFYQDLTRYALSDKNVPVDPVKAALTEHEKRLDKYAKDLEVQATTLREKEEMASHNAKITEAVIPLLTNNPEKYETLLLEYGPNAAVQVYQTVWGIYQNTGVARSFEEVASEIEDFLAEKVNAGINNASKLKRFAGRFAQSPSQTNSSSTIDQTENAPRSATLSNKYNTSALPASNGSQAKYKQLSMDERVAAILKKF
jgi:hypothetical protein